MRRSLLSRVYRRLRPQASFLDRIPLGAVTLAELRTRAAPYPTDVLTGKRSALLLFGAAFLGVNDAVHVSNSGLEEVTVVDIDAGRLETMERLYPAQWEFVAGDAFAFAAAQAEAGAQYDLVSMDPFTDLMPRCRELLPTFLQLARDAVVLGIEHGHAFDPPAGWSSRRLERSDLADWIVLEPA